MTEECSCNQSDGANQNVPSVSMPNISERQQIEDLQNRSELSIQSLNNKDVINSKFHGDVLEVSFKEELDSKVDRNAFEITATSNYTKPETISSVESLFHNSADERSLKGQSTEILITSDSTAVAQNQDYNEDFSHDEQQAQSEIKNTETIPECKAISEIQGETASGSKGSSDTSKESQSMTKEPSDAEVSTSETPAEPLKAEVFRENPEAIVTKKEFIDLFSNTVSTIILGNGEEIEAVELATAIYEEFVGNGTTMRVRLTYDYAHQLIKRLAEESAHENGDELHRSKLNKLAEKMRKFTRSLRP